MTQAELWTDLPSGPVEPVRARTLASIDTDYRRGYDRELIDAAVQRVAARDGGRVSTNAVRRELTNGAGKLRVQPQCIGPRLRNLTLAGVLAVTAEWEPNNDVASGNAGKPQRVRRWVT